MKRFFSKNSPPGSGQEKEPEREEPEAQPRPGTPDAPVKPVRVTEKVSAGQRKKISARIHIPPISLRQTDDGGMDRKRTGETPVVPPAPKMAKLPPRSKNNEDDLPAPESGQASSAFAGPGPKIKSPPPPSFHGSPSPPANASATDQMPAITPQVSLTPKIPAASEAPATAEHKGLTAFRTNLVPPAVRRPPKLTVVSGQGGKEGGADSSKESRSGRPALEPKSFTPPSLPDVPLQTKRLFTSSMPPSTQGSAPPKAPPMPGYDEQPGVAANPETAPHSGDDASSTAATPESPQPLTRAAATHSSQQFPAADDRVVALDPEEQIISFAQAVAEFRPEGISWEEEPEAESRGDFDDAGIRVIFDSEEPLDTYERVAAKLASLTGVTHCIVIRNDGSLLAGQWPEVLDVESFAVTVPNLVSRVMDFSGEMDLGQTHSLVLFTDHGTISFYSGDGIYLAVLQQSGGLLPGVRDKLERTAAALSQAILAAS